MLNAVRQEDRSSVRKRILIVDDVPENIDVLKGILEKHYQVQVAKSGQAALAIIQRSLPDLIVLDVMMPDMNGFEVCQQLKSDANTTDIPVIFLTATTDVSCEQEGFRVGGVDFITKPISPLTTLARVATHLHLSGQHKQDKHLIECRTKELDQALKSAIGMLSEAGQLKDADTGIHMWRMADYSAALANAIGWQASEVELLKLAAPMHDTGKIGIPDAILKSSNALSEEEWKIMKQHTLIGHQILIKGQAPLFKLAAEVALGHHEKWDGSGYPFGLSGQEIPISARIIAIADVFDALTMTRPYKKGWSIEKSLAHIAKAAHSHFDPVLVEAFLSIEEEIRAIKAKWDDVER